MSFLGFRIIKIFFSINEDFKYNNKPIPISHTLSLASKYNKKNKVLLIFLKVSITKGYLPFSIEIEGEGKFAFEESPDEKMIKQFSSVNCPAIIFPFLRETIADITRRAGFAPIYIPPIDFTRLSKEIPKTKEQNI